MITCIQSLTDFYDTTKIDLWPRTWKLIPLSSGIDLGQVLFDFVMSCVECAYNGTNIVVTPRCFLTLLTCYNFLTALLLQSVKTQLRVKKYYRRQCKTFVYDTYDNVNRYQELQHSTFIPNPSSSFNLESESVKPTNELSCFFVVCIIGRTIQMIF